MRNLNGKRRRSRKGFSVLVPPGWTWEEDETAFTLYPPADAAINVFQHDKAEWIENGAVMLPSHPPLTWFKTVVVTGVIKKRPSLEWTRTDEALLEIGRHPAWKKDLIAKGEPKLQWRLYGVETENSLYAILLEVSISAFHENEALFEDVIQSMQFADGPTTGQARAWWKFW